MLEGTDRFQHDRFLGLGGFVPNQFCGECRGFVWRQ